MRQQRPEWKARVRKVYLRRCAEGKGGDKVSRELLAEFHRAAAADKRSKYYYTHPTQAKARSVVRTALRGGNLIRPTVCSRCGAECKPEGHHHSYEVADRLDVEWLCPKCHKAIHKGG